MPACDPGRIAVSSLLQRGASALLRERVGVRAFGHYRVDSQICRDRPIADKSYDGATEPRADVRRTVRFGAVPADRFRCSGPCWATASESQWSERTNAVETHTMALNAALKRLIETKLAHTREPQWVLPITEVRQAFRNLWTPDITGEPVPIRRIEDVTIPGVDTPIQAREQVLNGFSVRRRPRVCHGISPRDVGRRVRMSAWPDQGAIFPAPRHLVGACRFTLRCWCCGPVCRAVTRLSCASDSSSQRVRHRLRSYRPAVPCGGTLGREGVEPAID